MHNCARNVTVAGFFLEQLPHERGNVDMSDKVKTKENSLSEATPTRKLDVKRLAQLSVLAALAYILMLVGRIPVVMFLKYDPKDIIIAFAGFIFGPLSAAGVSVVVSLIEMVTVSSEGIIGMIMNVFSTISFAVVAAAIYKKRKSVSGAVIGLIVGTIATTATMLLWNYLILPLYMKGVDRETVAGMLLPVFLPFNLLKGSINSTLLLALYKPLTNALKKSRLIPQTSAEAPKKGEIAVKNIAMATLLLVAAGLVLYFYFTNKAA